MMLHLLLLIGYTGTTMNDCTLLMDICRLNEEIAKHCFARVQDEGLCP